MLNMLGGNRVYVVPEIHFLLDHLRKFKIIGVDVDVLPPAAEADRTCVYYRASSEETEIEGITYPKFDAFVPAERDGEWVWYTCSGVVDYEKLANLPHYRLEENGADITFKGEVSPVLAQPITEEEILAAFDDWPVDSGNGDDESGDNEGTNLDYLGKYTAAANIIEEIQSNYLTNTESFGLSYSLELKEFNITLSSEGIEVYGRGCYGEHEAHYPRDYTLITQGTYAVTDNGDETCTISSIQLDWDNASVSGAYTGGHNDVGTCVEGDENKHPAGEAIEIDMSSAAVALGKAIASAIATKYLGGSLIYKNCNLYNGDVLVATQN